MALEKKNFNILCIGLSCVDIISVCKSYPVEDTDQRCVEQRWQQGGNAANTAKVISLLPTRCCGQYMGTLASSRELAFMEEEMCKSGVDFSSCVYFDDAKCPVSIVLINEENGSRTIIHARKSLPELSAEALTSINLAERNLSWIHCEGRPNVPAMINCLRRIDEFNETQPYDQHIKTSVEFEKSRSELIELIDKADYVFVSKEHAQFQGYSTKEEAVKGLVTKCRDGASIICPWGEQGAVAITKLSSEETSDIIYAPIYPPKRVIDTLAAGDTFIAGTISALVSGRSLEEAIDYGCRVAGAKCGMQGLSGLKQCNELCLE